MKNLRILLMAFATMGILTITPVAAFTDKGTMVSATGGQANTPPTILEVGGPDEFGYYFIDSEDPSINAPEFNWIDISGYGTDIRIVTDDIPAGPFPIGFTFNFYGVDFTSFNASPNGWASFTSLSVANLNQSIPGINDPNNLLAVFWDDLHPRSDGHAYYYSNNSDTLIIAWHDFARYIGDGHYDFEVILTADGNILYQYESLTGILDSHTIGIENSEGSIGLQYVFDTYRDESGTAILFTTDVPNYNGLNVLIAGGNFSADVFINELRAYTDIGNVDYLDASYDSPSLSLLQEYDCVVAWIYNNVNQEAFGNVLADYLDAGGAVVLGQFSFSDGSPLQGRIMSEYSPFIPGQLPIIVRNMGNVDAGHQIMQGVGACSDALSANVSLQHSPILVASYDDGTPMVAYNSENNLVALNSYVGDFRTITGDIPRLFHNAITFAADGPAQILLLDGSNTGAVMAKAELKAYDDISSVHVYNPVISTPSPDLLEDYDVVLVWSDYHFNDATMLGDRLADYVDMGGGAILTQFCFGTSLHLQGRMADSYSPFSTGNTPYEWKDLGSFDPDHPLMAGVSAVTEYYSAEVSLVNGGESVALWQDNTPFVAYNPDHSVVGINGYIGDNRQFTGEMMMIVHNSVNFLGGTTAIGDDMAQIPGRFGLSQNYPNPFNASTTISYELPQQSKVTIGIYDVLGRLVNILVDEEKPAGKNQVTWNADDQPSGVYFYRLQAGDIKQSSRMVLLK